MLFKAILVWSFVSVPALAGPRECWQMLVGHWHGLVQRLDDWSWRQSYPGFPTPRENETYRERLAADTKLLRLTFRNLELGNFKTRVAIREVLRLAAQIDQLGPDLALLSKNSWLRLELQKRQTMYYEYLFRLYHDLYNREELLDLPPELIRAGARALAIVEASEWTNIRSLPSSHLSDPIDVEGLLYEKALRAQSSY